MSMVTLFAGIWLSLPTPVRAEVVLMGNDGWEVSIDGSVNTFAVFSARDSIEDATVDADEYFGGAAGSGAAKANDNTFRVMNGLLPAVFGFNIKAPTINNLNMFSRLGLYPHVHNYNREKNKLGQNNIGSTLDLREVFFSVTHDKYGSMLFGKTLSLFLGKNILTDMTLFGVGGVSHGVFDGAGDGNTLAGSTTLGRIGFGYVYPNFNASIRYTTPTFNNAQLSVGIYDPSRIGGSDDANRFTETPEPRLEAELSHTHTFRSIGLSVDSWGNAMYQNAENGDGGDRGSAQAWGLGGGFQVKWEGLALTGSGYWGKGLGSILMLDTDSLDHEGNTRRNYGYIAQATYDLPDTILKDVGVGASLGASYNSATGAERARGHLPQGDDIVRNATLVRHNRLIDFMAWHNFNPNLRLVGEFGVQNVRWRDGANVDSYIFSMGGFFFF
ncbi:MAG: hypothetical protein GDA50_01295 [Alphaproteobacteria bacterium GM202ARS2]|nr:hypothetical protein [Alphaproteobacteria bacterium GM202ARS2]